MFRVESFYRGQSIFIIFIILLYDSFVDFLLGRCRLLIDLGLGGVDSVEGFRVRGVCFLSKGVEGCREFTAIPN